jgi:hypothetical protein
VWKIVYHQNHEITAMKKILLSLIVLCVFYSAFAQQVTMYVDENYGGASKAFSPGTRISKLDDFNPSGFWRGFGFGCGDICNDNITSLKVPTGLKVTVYEHMNFTGRSRVFTADCPNVGPEWNDIITGFVVEYNSASPPLSTTQNCQGNGVVNFYNTYSQSVWLFYWYAEDVANGSEECKVRRLWKQLAYGNNTFQIPKNKTLVYRIYTRNVAPDDCSSTYTKLYGSAYSCQWNNGTVPVN